MHLSITPPQNGPEFPEIGGGIGTAAADPNGRAPAPEDRDKSPPVIPNRVGNDAD